MEQTKLIASDSLLMDQLHNRDWEAFWLRLMGRCFWLLRKRYSIKWNNEKVKEFSRSAIGDIINKVFIEKKRNWNVERYPDFEDFIIGAIDSHVNNLLNKKVIETSIDNYDKILPKNIIDGNNAQLIAVTKELSDNIFNELEKAGAEDDELLIFECLVDGLEKPDEIKQELGMSDSDFHNAWRRFKRRRKLIQQKLAENGY
tara:strand:+ start:1386 stop:1988 length:603 start_codon:yes stop_codon:yes gene_type:complete